MITINRSKYKPCWSCKGVATKDGGLCEHCGGYGSIGLKIVMQAKARMMRGDKMRPTNSTEGDKR